MKNILRGLFAIASLLIGIQACARTPAEHEQRLLQKTLDLSVEACKIYPAINDLGVCVDKIVRKILADRDVIPERAEEIILKQAAAYAEKYPPNNIADRSLSAEVLQGRLLINKVIDITSTACTLPPAITDFELCMDKVYHSILSVRDQNSVYFNAKEVNEFFERMNSSLQGIGIEVGYAEEKAIGVYGVFKDSPAERAGIQVGDRIVAIINGDERVLTSSFTDFNVMMGKIKGEPGTKVSLEILRGEADQLHTVTAVRAAIKVSMVKSEVIALPDNLDTKFAYVRLTQFGMTIRKEMVDALTQLMKDHPDLTGVVIDLRDNRGGELTQSMEVIDAVTDSPEPLISIRDNGGIHVYGSDGDKRMPQPLPGDITNGLPIGVFINGNSASASEIVAGSLKKLGRSVTIGKRTWRKGTVQKIMGRGDGSATKTTESEYLLGTPQNWDAVQCVGVLPDILYEIEGSVTPAEEVHDCTFDGSVVSGGVSTHPNRYATPLSERNPAQYAAGLQMLDAVKVLDARKVADHKRIQRLLKIKEEVAIPFP